MLAVINLFIYILKLPTLETVPSDLMLLDLTAGHFARVHFLTSSQVSFTFAREIVGLANKTVRRATMAAPSSRNNSSAYTPELFSVDMSGEPVKIWVLFSTGPSFSDADSHALLHRPRSLTRMPILKT